MGGGVERGSTLRESSEMPLSSSSEAYSGTSSKNRMGSLASSSARFKGAGDSCHAPGLPTIPRARHPHDPRGQLKNRNRSPRSGRNTCTGCAFFAPPSRGAGSPHFRIARGRRPPCVGPRRCCILA